jgi:hypothetical protein
MDARNSLLAAVLFLLAVLLIAPMAIYKLLRTPVPTDELQPTSTASRSVGTPPHSSKSPAPTTDALPSPLEDDSEEKLRELIARKNDLLAQQREALKSKELALQQLQSEQDAALRLVEDLLGQADESEGDGFDDEGTGTPLPSRQEMEAELKQLREELDEARMAEMMLTMELQQLRERSAVDMADAQLTAQQALDEERMLQQVASQALAESGEAALPILVLMLRDERPRIRAWAADVLGRMGPRGGDAVMPLSDLANSDPEEGVRDAAVRALRAIRD